MPNDNNKNTRNFDFGKSAAGGSEPFAPTPPVEDTRPLFKETAPPAEEVAGAIPVDDYPKSVGGKSGSYDVMDITRISQEAHPTYGNQRIFRLTSVEDRSFTFDVFVDAGFNSTTKIDGQTPIESQLHIAANHLDAKRGLL